MRSSQSKCTKRRNVNLIMPNPRTPWNENMRLVIFDTESWEELSLCTHHKMSIVLLTETIAWTEPAYLSILKAVGCKCICCLASSSIISSAIIIYHTHLLLERNDESANYCHCLRIGQRRSTRIVASFAKSQARPSRWHLRPIPSQVPSYARSDTGWRIGICCILAFSWWDNSRCLSLP